MTETSVSTPEDWHFEKTSDGRIRFSIREHVSLWNPYDFSRMSVEGSQIARELILDRLPPEEPNEA